MRESVRLASLAFWNGVVPFAPVAVFALFAAEAGTLRVGQAESIMVFLLLLLVGTLGLALWVLPALVSAFTPMRSREVVAELRGAFVIAVATSLSVASLPFVTAATQRLMDSLGVKDADRDDVIRTNLSVAYPLGQLGNYFVYLFMIFASSFYNVALDPLKQLMLPVVTFLSCIGSPTSSVDAVTFLSAWMGLPADTTAFYVGLMALTRYGQVVASVAGFAFLSFTVVSAFYGKLHVRPLRLGAVVASAIVLALSAAWGGRALTQRLEAQAGNPYLDLSVDPALTSAVRLAQGPGGPDAGPRNGESTLAHIQRTGELRVGVNASIIPFCYRNAAGALAGYDVAFAYRLAADLNVMLRFVPFKWEELAADLRAGRFDIAMAGIYVTDDRLAEFEISSPYFQSPLALFMPRERVAGFRSRAEIEARGAGVRLGVFNDPVLLPRVRRTFSNAQIVVVPDYTTVPDFSKIDAAVWTLEQAEALAAAHRGLVAVEPEDAGNPYLFAYLMPPGSREFSGFVDYWLELKKSEGFDAEQRDYWIHRQPRQDVAPRWSILRDVLGIGRSPVRQQ
ncbi:MAG: cation:dicarboxylate symporter family transporter, partial [Chthoniobacterales bacterium]